MIARSTDGHVGGPGGGPDGVLAAAVVTGG